MFSDLELIPEASVGILEDAGIEAVRHYAPLHYLPFIARSRLLMCKPALRAQGFAPSHLRSMSSKHDRKRGFGEYAFLTLDRSARILAAKLDAGFPHCAIEVPASAFETLEFHLCRYNVAMTRYLKRGNRHGFPESDVNGRYYGDKQIPIAKVAKDKAAMLAHHLPLGTMIEVLVPGNLPLTDEVKVLCYSKQDAQIAQRVLGALTVPWEVDVIDPPTVYNRDADYASAVENFVSVALRDPDWKGNGLEFDRV